MRIRIQNTGTGAKFISMKIVLLNSGSAEFHEHIWTTCALLLLECNSDENIGYQIDLMRDIQELASNPAQNIRLNYASR